MSEPKFNNFSEKVAYYGSVSAALQHEGYSKSDSGWSKNSTTDTPAAANNNNNAGGGTTKPASTPAANKGNTNVVSYAAGSAANQNATDVANRNLNAYGFDSAIDYSLALRNATDPAEIEQLKKERQAKIDYMYNGADPYTNNTVNTVTGKETTAANTASKVYGSSWTPQTATAQNTLDYRAQQAVSGGQTYADFLSQNATTNIGMRDADLAWAKAGGVVPYTSGPNAGKGAWYIDPKGYNTSQEDWLSRENGLVDSLIRDGVLGKDGSLPYGEAAIRDYVDEYINQKKLWAKYNGVTYDPMADFNIGQALIGAPQMGSAGAGGPGAATGNGTNKAPNGSGVQNNMNPNSGGVNNSYTGNININGGNGGNFNAPNNSMYDYLEQWFNAATKQQNNAIDWATSQQIQETLRAQQEADAQFQNTRDQIAIDEAKAKDNQALYAGTRGDKGGIGASQYDSIMNTAAQNRLSVNQAQTQMAADTASTISNLRAQGEYEKADALLELSQTYLAQLISLEQWAAEYGLSVAQFQAQLDQWQKDYQLNYAQVMGNYNGTPTLEAQQYQDSLALNQQETLAEQGWQALSLGVTPSAAQLSAMGVTADQVNTYLMSQQLAASSKGNGGGGNPSKSATPKETLKSLPTGSAEWQNAVLSGASGRGQSAYDYLIDAGLSQSNAERHAEDLEPILEAWSGVGVSSIAKGMATDLTKNYASQNDKMTVIFETWLGEEKRNSMSDKQFAVAMNRVNETGDWGESGSWMTETDLYYLLHQIGRM